MRVRVGTSGFAYPAWKPAFYPADVPASRFLRFYATRFSAVEVNATFYRMPTAPMLGKWPPQVGDGFAFALKAPQAITHVRKLEGAADAVQRFVEASEALGPHRGPLLFQLPPWLRADLPRLRAFLAEVPRGPRLAFEFRHASWNADAVHEALREAGAALCVAESEERRTPLVPTAVFGYLRLRELDYGDAELAAWAERILAQPWEEAFVFFKHEEQGRGPRLADALVARLGPHAVVPANVERDGGTARASAVV